MERRLLLLDRDLEEFDLEWLKNKKPRLEILEVEIFSSNRYLLEYDLLLLLERLDGVRLRLLEYERRRGLLEYERERL